jgi:URI fold toxin 2
MKKPHANSHENEAEHHLYEIFDIERDKVFKYGISGKPLNSDGTSPRANEQVALFNRVVGMNRFFARVILTQIDGRLRALEIEDENTEKFREQYGSKPPGNL